MSSKDPVSYYKNKAICCLDPCRGEAIPVIYGTPGAELSKLSFQKLVHLAGCFVSEKKATYYCTKCHKYIYPNSQNQNRLNSRKL